MISALDAVLVSMLLVGLTSGWVPISAAFMVFILAVLITGRISVTQGLQLLGDPATVAVICLVLFSNVLGRLAWLRTLLFDRHQHGVRRTLLRFLSVAGLVSAVLPNTAVVGAFMGPAARRADISAHQLLMPLSYMALAGGMVTHFGTTANLMVVGQAEKYGIELTSFQFMPIGAAVMIAVLVVLVIVSPLLLRAPDQSGSAQGELFHVEARVTPGSPLVGRTLIENKLRNLGHFYVAELIRDDHIFSPVGPYEPLNENDVLIFVGDVRYIEEISSLPGLEIEHEARPRPKQNIYHAVVSASSTLTGTNLKEARFRGRFDASVFAVRRGNERLSGKLGEIRLKGGDLLVLAAGSDFYSRDDVRANLHIVDVEDPGQSKLTRASTIFVSLLFLAFVAVALTEVINFTLATLLLVSIGFFSGLLNLRDLRRSFPFELVVALWGALMLGTLIATSGMADVAASWIVGSISSAPPFAVLIVVFIFTWLLTEMLSNTSAALVALPVALQVARQMEISPEALALTVAFGASASFLLPFGYQTHLMVMSPGNYQALDFIKLGSIVLLCYAVVALTMIHWLYF